MTRAPGRDGFTLIEVLGALVIFVVGVLMTLNMTDAASTQLERAALRSELAAMARTRMDSLETVGFSSLAPGTQTRAITVRGQGYREMLEVAPFSPLVVELKVSFEPDGAGSGPVHTIHSYVAGPWQP